MSNKRDFRFTPFWWALQLKQGRVKAKPKSGRCMFCGMRTQKKVEENICVTCFEYQEKWEQKEQEK
mgnify:CR=1 FL=1